MRIVVLDGHALNPGDLDWTPLADLGELTVHDRTAPGEVAERSRGAEILLTNKVVISAEVIQELDGLRYIGVLATGYNVVDTRAAAERGVVVTNVPAYATDSVAQAVFAHLLNITHRVGEHAREVRRGAWSASPDFCYAPHPLTELAGRTFGIVGLGRIGQATARIADAFGMGVIAYNPSGHPDAPESVEPVSLAEVFARSDVLSLHCPLTPATLHLVNSDRLASMKPGAILINTGRGALVDETALSVALRAGHLSAAGLDVLEQEPPPGDHPLIGLENCFVTGHIAWATRQARERLLRDATDNVAAFLRGSPRHVVS